MKGVKILSIATMFLLCITMLCVGVYSASYFSVGVVGELSIIPAPAGVSVNVKTYIGESLEKDYGSIKNLQMKYSGNINASAFNGTNPLILSIEITNESDKELGAFFLDTTVEESLAFDSDGLVAANGIKISHEYTDVSVYLASYSYIAIANANNSYDTVNMTMTFIPKVELDVGTTINYSFSLYIEEYVSNMNSEDLKVDDAWETNGGTVQCVKSIPANLVKIDSGVTLLPQSAFSTYDYSESDVVVPAEWNGIYPNYVVIPSSITEIPYGCFLGTENLYGIFIPSSVTNIGTSAFQETTMIKCMILPEGVTTIEHNVFTYSKIEYLFFPSTLTETGYNVTSYSKIKYVYIPKGENDITLYSGVQANSGKTWYLNGTAIANWTSFVISSTTNNIYVCK